MAGSHVFSAIHIRFKSLLAVRAHVRSSVRVSAHMPLQRAIGSELSLADGASVVLLAWRKAKKKSGCRG